MLDILVTRTPFNLDGTDLSDNCKCPLINGGDAALRHPTQTLIDLFAISEFRGELSDLRLAICGDLQTRATRSFLAWLTRHPPRMLKLIAPKSRSNHGLRLNEALLRVTEVSDRMQLQDIDVVYMTGLAQGEGEAYLSADDRSPFILTTDTIRELPVDAIVLSPMPLIDEIDRVVLHDERMRVFAQSDLGVPVRMAIIELLLLPWINKNSS
jgi:aspartate carbamoyltransferase catalytic subunit